MGPSPVNSISSYKYYVIFVDHHTGYCWIYPLFLKSEVVEIFCTFKNYVERFFESKINVFGSDGGGEFTSTSFKHFFSSTEIGHQLSCPHKPKQNGVAECKHHHIIETGLFFLVHCLLPTKYWFEAFITTVFLIIGCPLSPFKKFPHMRIVPCHPMAP